MFLFFGERAVKNTADNEAKRGKSETSFDFSKDMVKFLDNFYFSSSTQNKIVSFSYKAPKVGASFSEVKSYVNDFNNLLISMGITDPYLRAKIISKSLEIQTNRFIYEMAKESKPS